MASNVPEGVYAERAKLLDGDAAEVVKLGVGQRAPRARARPSVAFAHEPVKDEANLFRRARLVKVLRAHACAKERVSARCACIHM